MTFASARPLLPNWIDTGNRNWQTFSFMMTKPSGSICTPAVFLYDWKGTLHNKWSGVAQLVLTLVVVLIYGIFCCLDRGRPLKRLWDWFSKSVHGILVFYICLTFSFDSFIFIYCILVNFVTKFIVESIKWE